MTISELLRNMPPAKVVSANGPFAPIDLSVNNPALTGLQSVADYQQYIHNFLAYQKASIAFGGYNEKRNLYDASELFNNDDSEPRNIHLGTDLWVEAGTDVFAAATGTVHSFAFNAGKGNYGPTIILEHAISGANFYTLYGHLSLENIGELEIGERFEAGDVIGQLGTQFENGGYAPHLHFQLILDLEGNFGDYPGVCSESSRNKFLDNCPDPNLLLKL